MPDALLTRAVLIDAMTRAIEHARSAEMMEDDGDLAEAAFAAIGEHAAVVPRTVRNVPMHGVPEGSVDVTFEAMVRAADHPRPQPTDRVHRH